MFFVFLWGGEFFLKFESLNDFEVFLDMAEAYCKIRMSNLDAALIIIKFVDGIEVDWFVDMCNCFSVVCMDGCWYIVFIFVIVESFVEKLASTANAYFLNGIEILEKIFINYVEVVVKYLG